MPENKFHSTVLQHIQQGGPIKCIPLSPDMKHSC